MKQGAIFDMDGLLFDTERVYNEEWHKVANTYGLCIHPEMLDALRGTNGDFMYRIVNRYWPNVDAKQLCDELFHNARTTLTHYVPIKKGAIELLTFFQEHGVRMAVASSAPSALIIHNLKVAGIHRFFEVVVSGEQVVHGKPEPDIFLLAAEQLGIEPQNCYVFEDGLHGVQAGIKAGCATIMVPDLVPPNKDICKKCVGIYASLIEVMGAIINHHC